MSVFSLAFAAIVSYFSFELIGLNFFRVASIEDTILIGVGLLVRLLPLVVMGYFHFLLCKQLFGFVVAFDAKVNQGPGIEPNKKALPYYIVSVIFTGIICLLLIINSAIFSYYNLLSNFLIIIGGIMLFFVFIFSTNFLISKGVVRFRETDPYFYVQTNRPQDLSNEAKLKRESFYSKTLKFTYFLAALGAFPALIYAVQAPLKSDFTVGHSGTDLYRSECIGSPVVWSGTRSVVFRCNGEIIVIQGPENVVLVSRDRKTLEQTLLDVFDTLPWQ